jgi:hypothetical protein
MDGFCSIEYCKFCENDVCIECVEEYFLFENKVKL